MTWRTPTTRPAARPAWALPALRRRAGLRATAPTGMVRGLKMLMLTWKNSSWSCWSATKVSGDFQWSSIPTVVIFYWASKSQWIFWWFEEFPADSQQIPSRSFRFSHGIFPNIPGDFQQITLRRWCLGLDRSKRAPGRHRNGFSGGFSDSECYKRSVRKGCKFPCETNHVKRHIKIY